MPKGGTTRGTTTSHGSGSQNRSLAQIARDTERQKWNDLRKLAIAAFCRTLRNVEPERILQLETHCLTVAWQDFEPQPAEEPGTCSPRSLSEAMQQHQRLLPEQYQFSPSILLQRPTEAETDQTETGQLSPISPCSTDTCCERQIDPTLDPMGINY